MATHATSYAQREPTHQRGPPKPKRSAPTTNGLLTLLICDVLSCTHHVICGTPTSRHINLSRFDARSVLQRRPKCHPQLSAQKPTTAETLANIFAVSPQRLVCRFRTYLLSDSLWTLSTYTDYKPFRQNRSPFPSFPSRSFQI